MYVYLFYIDNRYQSAPIPQSSSFWARFFKEWLRPLWWGTRKWNTYHRWLIYICLSVSTLSTLLTLNPLNLTPFNPLIPHLLIIGRIVLNLWRRLRAELKLQSYNRTHVTLEFLDKRVPHFSQEQLLRWFESSKTRDRTIRHVFSLADLNIEFVDKLDLVRRTSESARLYGIDFFSVLSRLAYICHDFALNAYWYFQPLLVT